MQLLQMFHTSRLIFFSGLSRLRGLQLVTIALTICVLAPLSACSQAEDGSRSNRRAIAQSQAIAADFLRTELALSPETASRLGLERTLGPTAAYALDNHSQAGFERRRLVRIELLQRLTSRPRLPDEHVLTRDMTVCESALRNLIELEQLGYGRFSYSELRPYAIDPFSGIWADGPALLAYRQSITRADQARAYLARLQSLSAALHDTRRRLLADQASGILLPRALAVETQARLTDLLATDQGGLPQIAETFRALTRDLTGFEPGERMQLVNAVETEISQNLRPAYRALIEAVELAARDGADRAGLWAQPRGQDVFAGILTASLGERLNTDRLHARQVQAVALRYAELQNELTSPNEGETSTPPRPETLSDQLAWFRALNIASSTSEVALSPVRSELATLARLAPASVWQRLERQADTEAQAMALTRFQSILQSAPYRDWASEEAGLLAPHRLLVEYPAITAGWRLYVWQQSQPSQGAQRNPLSHIEQVRIGLIQDSLAVMDTGLHLDRWTLEEAADFLSTQTGLDPDMSEQLALSIAARPGHHSAIMVAVHRIEALSERAQAVLGANYNELEFQRVLIQPGPRPLPMIESDIEAWYGAQLARPSGR